MQQKQHFLLQSVTIYILHFITPSISGQSGSKNQSCTDSVPPKMHLTTGTIFKLQADQRKWLSREPLGVYSVIYFEILPNFFLPPGWQIPAPLPWFGGGMSWWHSPVCSPGLQVASAPQSEPHDHADCSIPSGPSSDQDTAGLWVTLSKCSNLRCPLPCSQNIVMESARGIQRTLAASRIWE